MPDSDSTLEEKLHKFNLRVKDTLRDLPLVTKTALEDAFRDNQDDEPDVGSAGRVGRQQGKVSELTAIGTLKEGGADHLRALLTLIGGKMSGARKVGTVHDMRFVIFDDDKKVLFCTAYDGDWDAYIEDFATKIPDLMDLIFANVEGWPGISSPTVKDFIADCQLTADGWYVDAPSLSVVDTRRLQRTDKLVEQFLDDYSATADKPADQMNEEELRAAVKKVEALVSELGAAGSGVS